MIRRLRSVATVILSRYWVLVVVIVAWQLWVQLNDYSVIVAPKPLTVIEDVLAHPTAYLPSLGWTAGMSVAGLMVGIFIGTLLAVGVWYSSIVSGLVNPVAVIMQSVPITAMIPIIISIVGFGEPAVLAVTSIISFFPAFVMVGAGLRSIPPATVDLFVVLGASKISQLFRLGLPSATVNAFVAIRITGAQVFLAAMLAEYLMGTHGLGVLFADSLSLDNIPRAWGTALVATCVAVVGFLAARRLERTVVGRLT